MAEPEANEEEKVETTENKRERFMRNYQEIMTKDEEIMEEQQEQ
jgi:hypothetical protein